MEHTGRLTYVGHATICIEMGGVRLLTDPILVNSVFHLRRYSSPVTPNVVRGIDAVLISHLHYDHLHRRSLRNLPNSTLFVVPKGARPLLQAWGFHNSIEIEPGESTTIGGVRIVATIANHRAGRSPLGPRTPCIGFLICGSHQIYFAGDTEFFDEMKTLSANLDIALLPVWGWGPTLGAGHMNPQQAAQALAALRPRIAIPIHWGTLFPRGLRWWYGSRLVDPPKQFVHHAALHAPSVMVKVLQPGETVKLDR